MDKQTLDDFKTHVAADYPHEAVGAVLTSGEYVPLNNIAAEPRLDFEVDFAEIHGKPITHILHSHTISELEHPSLADQVNSQNHAFSWGLIRYDGRNFSRFVEWGPYSPVEPLVGRSYCWFIRDCWTVIRDWFRLEHDLVLPNPPRDYNEWVSARVDMYDHHLRLNNFTRVDSPQVGDVVVVKLSMQRPHHAGVIVNNSEILHHFGPQAGRLSETTGLQWLRRPGTRLYRLTQQS